MIAQKIRRVSGLWHVWLSIPASSFKMSETVNTKKCNKIFSTCCLLVGCPIFLRLDDFTVVWFRSYAASEYLFLWTTRTFWWKAFYSILNDCVNGYRMDKTHFSACSLFSSICSFLAHSVSCIFLLAPCFKIVWTWYLMHANIGLVKAEL